MELQVSQALFFPSRLRVELEIIVGAAGNGVCSYSISLNGLEST